MYKASLRMATGGTITISGAEKNFRACIFGSDGHS